MELIAELSITELMGFVHRGEASFFLGKFPVWGFPPLVGYHLREGKH